MRRLMSGAMILAAVFALGPIQVAAQRRQPAPQAPGRMMRPGGRWMGARAGAGVEGVMRMRERLKLTDDQFRKLDQIRAEIVQRRAAHLTRLIELRSKVSVGEATRGALVDSLTAWRKASASVRKQQRDRVEAVLTQAQKDTLKSIVARRRAFAAGRASAMRGRMGQRMWRGRGGFMSGRGSGFMRGPRGAFRDQRGWGRGFGPPLPDSGSAPAPDVAPGGGR